MLGPSALALSRPVGPRLRGSSGESDVPLPDAMEAVDRMACGGGRKAQGRDFHALVLEVEQTRGEVRKRV
jgi:hypothetical protein